MAEDIDALRQQLAALEEKYDKLWLEKETLIQAALYTYIALRQLPTGELKDRDFFEKSISIASDALDELLEIEKEEGA